MDKPTEAQWRYYHARIVNPLYKKHGKSFARAVLRANCSHGKNPKDMSMREFSKYIDHCIRFLAGLGVVISNGKTGSRMDRKV